VADEESCMPKAAVLRSEAFSRLLKKPEHVIPSKARCRSLLEDFAVIGTRDLLWFVFNKKQPAAARLATLGKAAKADGREGRLRHD
jgi:hypothetical protein